VTGQSGVVGRDDPTVASHASLSTIETAVDENSCEPDFEGPGLAIRADVAEHLHESVLDRFVGFCSIAQILKRNSQRAPLVGRDETSEPLARLIHFAALDQFSDFNGKARIVR
jgi:hypothetical protein